MAKKQGVTTEGPAVASSSRYTSPPVTLRVGPDLESYYVPEVLLQSLINLPRSEDTKKTIHFPDMDATLAHTVVHFLHTEEYQMLPHDGEDPAICTGTAEFKQAIATFIVAKRYGLTGLQDLAKLETQRAADGISVVQAAHAIAKDTLKSLAEDAGWLQGLVLRKVEQTFVESDETFSSGSFFNGIKSLNLAKALGQKVAELYRDSFRQLRGQLDPCEGRETPKTRTSDRETNLTVHELMEAAIENDPSTRPFSEMVTPERPVFQTSETLPQAHCVTAEPVTQSDQEMHAAGEHALVVSAVESNTRPAHEVEAKCGMIEPPPVGEGPDAQDHAPDSLPRVLGVVASTSKDSLRTQYMAGTGPFEGIKSKKKMLKLWRKLRAQIPGATEGTEEEPTTVKTKVEEVTIDTLREIPAVKQSLDEIEEKLSATNLPAIDSFTGPSKSQKRELEKKLNEEAIAEEKHVDAFIPQEVVAGSDLIELEPDSAVDMDVSDDEHCPSRLEHLARNGQWKDCSNCEAHMRKIAIKLYAVGMPEVNGLVAR